MPVTERLMRAGQWSLHLNADTPKATRDLLDYFGHVYIFDTTMRDGIGDAAMIAASRWGGVLRRRQTPFDASGANMVIWLGDEDGKGPIWETAKTGTGATFAAFIALLLPPAVASGTLTAVAGTLTNTYQWVTPRAAIDHLCAYFNAEYRVNKDATFDAGPYGTSLFNWTPTAVAMRYSSGRDQSIVGLSTTRLDVSIDSDDYYTRQLIQDATSAWTARDGAVTTYKDLRGNLVDMRKATVSSQTPNAAAATLAQNLANVGPLLRQEVTLSLDEFDIPRDVMVGDSIHVYDPQSNMVDTANPIRYRGSIVYPIKLRVLASTWPIERGMGVWYRDKAGIWTDLTRFVAWEAPGVTFEVGASTRRLLVSP